MKSILKFRIGIFFSLVLSFSALAENHLDSVNSDASESLRPPPSTVVTEKQEKSSFSSLSIPELGKLVKAEESSDKVFVLFYWGYGCAPCKKMLPKLIEVLKDLRKQHGDKVVLVLVHPHPKDDDDRAGYTKGVEALKVKFSNENILEVKDNEKEALINEYDVEQLPTTVIISKGKKRKHFIETGYKEDSTLNKIREVTTKYLKE